MPTDTPPTKLTPVPSPPFTTRRAASRLLGGVMEALVLALVCLAPWPYGSVHPAFESLLDAAVAVLVTLWGARMLLDGALTWKRCPVALCLAALFLVSAAQVIPLPRAVLGRLSPSTLRTYQQLLPARPEAPPDGAPEDLSPGAAAGATLSLYPGATRQELVRLLAVFLLFAVVRNNAASPAALRRLAVAAVANGALLAAFGLAQSLTSPRNTLYWTYPSEGDVFGPFVCRNHFAFYVNMCVGLGVGLLLGAGGAGGQAGGARDWAVAPLRLLARPGSAWVCAAVALMAAGVAMSLSRGGVVALGGAAAVCLTLGLLRLRRRPGGAAGALLALVLAAGFIAWFDAARVGGRLATLGGGAALREGRVSKWAESLSLARDFPVWGTGLGTFPYVEPLHRAAPEDVVYDHAHNDYLEALVEGGVVRLAVSLLAVAVVFHLGYRAARRRGRGASALALGALFGFTALALHSLVDFGIHIPAVAVLATVLCAHLSAAGEGEPSPPVGAGAYSLRLGGLAPLLGATAALALACVLAGEGWRAGQAESWRVAAWRWGDARPGGGQRRVAALETAARLAPEDAGLRLELARAHLDAYEAGAALARERAAAGAARAVLALAPAGGPPASAPAAIFLGDVGEDPAREERLRRELASGLAHLLRARDLCPLLPETHLLLAANARRLAGAEEPGRYLDRVTALAPTDPTLWYLCGRQELADGRPDRAWSDWRESLKLSDRHLSEVLGTAVKRLGPRGVLDRVLPDDPDLLVRVAGQLYPGPGAAPQRRPFQERALDLLGRQPGADDADRLHLRASLQRSLGRPEEAADSYRAALARRPQESAWWLELAELLHDQGRPEEARRALLEVVAREPGDRRAHELLESVELEIAKGP